MVFRVFSLANFGVGFLLSVLIYPTVRSVETQLLDQDESTGPTGRG